MIFKPCPDEEGIKTLLWRSSDNHSLFKPCPDEEGIKTPKEVLTSHGHLTLNLALMKKGLRHHLRFRTDNHRPLNLALMKKGLRPRGQVRLQQE